MGRVRRRHVNVYCREGSIGALYLCNQGYGDLSDMSDLHGVLRMNLTESVPFYLNGVALHSTRDLR